MRISEKSYELIIEAQQLTSIDSLWYLTKKPSQYELPEVFAESYERRIELFILILEALIERRDICLTNSNRVESTDSRNEQLNKFKNAFPSEVRMKEIEHYWWYLDECPFRLVWLLDEDIPGWSLPYKDGKYYYRTS
ncbi:DUF596 domain-containing protein [Emticicia agri]|uniref:DUF596 domain-containing protein n=1 Tax=Emticicia agri TaxID=2492393 RepID=A0A4Q5M6M7_9BACT|nr:DUF596 domain-containing protein [Emticicia agri]RYU97753.1 DUF596 domain-containing protein [Emticicia agri]